MTRATRVVVAIPVAEAAVVSAQVVPSLIRSEIDANSLWVAFFQEGYPFLLGLGRLAYS